MSWLWFILIAPGLFAAYFMFVRPVLKAIPAFKNFYAEAETIEQKFWAICGKSLTMAWSYFLGVAGGILNQIDSIAATLGDPNFKEQFIRLVNADPKALGYFMMAVSAVTIAARLRSIAKAS
jgi:hypothetical protein